MKSFKHLTAKKIEEACAFLSEYNGRARINAGGTDLLLTLKGEILNEYPDALIDVKGIHHLDDIKEDETDFKIGALVRLSDIASSPLIHKKIRILAEAAQSVASPQIRNVATIGGNLCQDTRCWYYRYPRNLGGPVQCLRKGSGSCLAIKGDNRYHSIFGGKKCFGICPSDTATALTALDAKLIIANKEGARTITISEFYHSLGNALQTNEMLKEILIPKQPDITHQCFLKYTLRKPIDFAVVSVASCLTIADGVTTDARVILGAVAAAPVRAIEAEDKLIGHPITPNIVEAAAELALAKAKPLNKNSYKINIAKSLLKQAMITEVHRSKFRVHS